MATLTPELEASYTKLKNRQSLDDKEMTALMEALMSGRLDDNQIERFLKDLREKGETASEISAAARVMRSHAVKPAKSTPGLLDTCGTGADNQHTINVSTLTALIVSSMGIPVAKHGNRSITSVCGSADLLELLGVKIDLPVSAVESEITKFNFGFFFAPLHHPATKVAGPARKKIQGKTLFNLLGPLSNPASAQYQLLGVYDKKLLKLMAEALRGVGVSKALVVHGADGMDEITLCNETYGAWLDSDGSIKDIRISPESVGLTRVGIESLRCETKEGSKEDALKVLKGEKGPKTDFVLLNAGAAVWLVGRAQSHKEGVEAVRTALAGGKALAHVKAIAEFSQSAGKA